VQGDHLVTGPKPAQLAADAYSKLSALHAWHEAYVHCMFLCHKVVAS